MRFLADENIPLVLVERLRALGHDVGWMRTDAPGLADVDVLRRSVDERRVCLTFDKDFGELTQKPPHAEGFGIVLFRVPMPTPAQAVRLADLVAARDDWPGHLSIVEPGRTRMRPLTARPDADA